MLARLMLTDPLEQVCRSNPHISIFMQQPQGQVEQASMRLWRYGKQQANLVIRDDAIGEGEIYLAALCWRQTLCSQPVV